MTVEVKPSFDTDTVLTFPSKGNEAYACHQSQLKVTFGLAMPSDISEIKFRRAGDDLIYTHTLTLEEALFSHPVSLRTLDNRVLRISLDKTITPQTVHTVSGEGMPRKSDSKQRGDLKIKFNIIFPTQLKNEHRQAILGVLRQEY